MSEEELEISEILNFLGISQIEGNIRGEHCMRILYFLKNNDGESWDYVKEVAPFQLGIGLRYLQENYLRGIIRLGIIKMYQEGTVLYYKWFGSKCLNGKKIIKINKDNPQDLQIVKDWKKHKEKENKNKNADN